jgi:hypothetical protein
MKLFKLINSRSSKFLSRTQVIILKQAFLLEDYQVDIQTMKLIVKNAVRIYNTKRFHWSRHMKTPQEIR